MKILIAFIVAVGACTSSISNAQSLDDEKRAAISEAWNMAIESKCKDPEALVNRAAFSEKVRAAIAKLAPSISPENLEISIAMSVDEVEKKYPRTPRKEICMFVEELRHSKEPASKTTQVDSTNVTPTIYKCDLDGKVMFSDKRYNSIPCKPLELPGNYSRPTSNARAATSPLGKYSQPLSVAEAKRIAVRNLRDPEATNFREVFLSKSGNVCGQLNSKNGYGAYVGYTSFFVLADLKLATIKGEQNSEAFSFDYRRACELKNDKRN